MRFNGAVVKTDNKTIAIAVVEADFLALEQTEKMAMMKKYATVFRNMPIVFMTQNANDESEFYGRKDLVDSVKEIPLTYMTWKEYKLKEDGE